MTMNCEKCKRKTHRHIETEKQKKICRKKYIRFLGLKIIWVVRANANKIIKQKWHPQCGTIPHTESNTKTETANEQKKEKRDNRCRRKSLCTCQRQPAQTHKIESKT